MKSTLRYSGLILFCLLAPLCFYILAHAQAQVNPIVTSTAKLTWDSNTEPDIADYGIRWGTVSGIYMSEQIVAHIQGPGLQASSVPGLLDGQTYFFVVRARDLSGNWSLNSTEVVATVVIKPGIPGEPGLDFDNLTAKLSWASNTESDMKHYKVFKGAAPGVYSVFKIVPHVAGSITSRVTFSDLTEGKKYYFAIEACDILLNCSAKTDPVSGVAMVPPGPPLGLSLKFIENVTP